MGSHPENLLLGPGFKIIEGPNGKGTAIGLIEVYLNQQEIPNISTQKLYKEYTLEPSKTLVTTKAVGDLGYKELNSRREKLNKFASRLLRRK